MSKNRFSSLKKQVEIKQQFHYYKYIVVGHSAVALQILNELKAKVNDDDILWLTEKEINFDYISRPLPTTIRGESNIALAKDLFGVEAFEESYSIFYKDMKFRSFGGRSKSMPLLLGEGFYSATGLNFKDIKQQFISADNCLALQKIVAIDSITYLENTQDLVAPKQWAIETKTHDVYEGQFLIWAAEPLEFYSYIKDEQQSHFKAVTEFLNESETVTELYISLAFDKVITDKAETIFIPLSLTHSEGHFIGQFVQTDRGQRADFIHLFDEEDCDENEVIKKIKTLKRALEKIFDVPKGVTYLNEFYSIDSVGVSSAYHFLDEKADPLFVNYPTLFFIGENAPLKWNSGVEQGSVSHFIRERLSFNFFKSFLIDDKPHN